MKNKRQWYNLTVLHHKEQQQQQRKHKTKQTQWNSGPSSTFLQSLLLGLLVSELNISLCAVNSSSAEKRSRRIVPRKLHIDHVSIDIRAVSLIGCYLRAKIQNRKQLPHGCLLTYVIRMKFFGWNVRQCLDQMQHSARDWETCRKPHLLEYLGTLFNIVGIVLFWVDFGHTWVWVGVRSL